MAPARCLQASSVVGLSAGCGGDVGGDLRMPVAFQTLDLFTSFHDLDLHFFASKSTWLTFRFQSEAHKPQERHTWDKMETFNWQCFQVSLQLWSLSIKNIGNNTWRYASVCLTFKMAPPCPPPAFHRPPHPPLSFSISGSAGFERAEFITDRGRVWFPRERALTRCASGLQRDEGVRDRVFFKGNCVTFTRVDGRNAACAARCSAVVLVRPLSPAR